MPHCGEVAALEEGDVCAAVAWLRPVVAKRVGGGGGDEGMSRGEEEVCVESPLMGVVVREGVLVEGGLLGRVCGAWAKKASGVGHLRDSRFLFSSKAGDL